MATPNPYASPATGNESPRRFPLRVFVILTFGLVAAACLGFWVTFEFVIFVSPKDHSHIGNQRGIAFLGAIIFAAAAIAVFHRKPSSVDADG